MGCLPVARDEAFHVLRDSARRVKLEVEQTNDLGARQKEARRARTYSDDLGMTNIHLCLEPHVGTPIVNRAGAEAARLHREPRCWPCHQAKTERDRRAGKLTPMPAERGPPRR